MATSSDVFVLLSVFILRPISIIGCSHSITTHGEGESNTSKVLEMISKSELSSAHESTNAGSNSSKFVFAQTPTGLSGRWSRRLSRVIMTALRRLYHVRHSLLMAKTSGLLPIEVYRELTDLVKRSPQGLDLIEVGGASGAATIAMSWGLQPSSTSASHVIVVEKCEGGSRTPYGGWEANKARFDRFMRRYKLQDRVILFPHNLTLDRGPEVRALLRTERIAGLLSDADGMVHRDLYLFGDLIDSNGFVVIDDYHPSLSPKHAVTYAVVNRLIEADAFRLTKCIHETLFGRPGSRVTESLYNECEQVAQSVCQGYGIVIDERGITPLAR